MGTTHDLKTWPEFFDAILDGRKTFEVRDTRDRDFAVGDVLRLREWTPIDGCRPGSYTGREATRTVSYIVRGAPFLPADLAVLGLIDDADGSSAEHWRAQYVKQVNLRHERNKESDAQIAAEREELRAWAAEQTSREIVNKIIADRDLAAVTAERGKALAAAARWEREYEGIRVDFAALVQKEMTLRAQVESALGGKLVQDPVSDAVILAQRVAQEREVAVRDGEAIRKAIGLDADASTTSVLARLAETHPDLLASGERATFLRRSGAETAKREMVLLCWNRCQAETDPEKVNALRATFNAMASVDLGAVEDLATLPPADYSILRDAAVTDVLRLRSELEAVTAERDRLQRACDEGLPREYIECPTCGKQHIEGPRHDNPALDGRKRPHHTHRCYHCGHVWPSGRWSFGADVPKPTEHAAALDAARREGAEGMRERCAETCASIASAHAERFVLKDAGGVDGAAREYAAREYGAAKCGAECVDAIRALPLDAPGGGS